MKIVMIFTILLAVTISWVQSNPEEAAIRKILDEEVAAWNKGDADAYSRHFATDGTFTNFWERSSKAARRSGRDTRRSLAQRIAEAEKN